MGLINPDFQTLPELFTSVFTHFRGQSGKSPFARKINGAYQPISYDSFAEDCQQLAAYLKSQGIEQSDRVAILSENRPGWYLADMAILSVGAIDVPLYPSLPPNQIEYILNNSGAKGIIVSNMLQLGKIMSIWQNLPELNLVIVMNRLEEPIEDVIDLNQAKTEGKRILTEKPWFLEGIRSEPDDIATIIYTSGTTGLPKGVMLTHRNLCENVKSCAQVIRLDETDRCLSFLPLSHAYERTGGYYLMFACGVHIYLAESIETISLNISEAKPSIIFTVPRLFDRIKTNILKSATSEGGMKQKIFFWAVRTGEKYHRQLAQGKLSPLLSMQHGMADRLVYSKIRKKFGGHLRFFVSGGAALPQKTGEFFQSIGITILEGFGLTETSPVTHINRPEKVKFGTVGPAIRNVEVRIAEDGEILLKGPNIMKGYWKDDSATADVMRDGWFCTGDIGEIDADGYLKITDRKKHIIVTSGGKNIAPLPIENMIHESPYVDQAMIVGEKRPFLIALIVPDFGKLKEFAAEHGIPSSASNRQLIEHKEVLQLFEKLLRNISRQLATHEKVRKFLLVDEAFTLDNGLMTPTLKLKRKEILKKYNPEIDNVYNALNMVYNTE